MQSICRNKKLVWLTPFLERPVEEGESGGELARKFVEPRIVSGHIHQADLHPVKFFGVIDDPQLQTIDVRRVINETGLQSFECSFGVIQKAVLPTDEFIAAAVDEAPLNAV